MTDNKDIFLTDTHAHLNDEAFDEDREEVIASMKGSIRWIINNGYDLESSRLACELAKTHDFLYATCGLHPHDSKDWNEEYEQALISLLSNEKCVAVGEIGLDYHYDNSPRDIQREVFIRQIDLAGAYNRPITIHSRDAVQDTYDILKEHLKSDRGAVMHSFSQSTEMLKRYLDMNVCFSISGIVTFKNAQHVREMVAYIPLDRLFIETDCPYMTPVPFRGRRNLPVYTEYTARTIAGIKNVSYEYLIETTCRNAEKFFNI